MAETKKYRIFIVEGRSGYTLRDEVDKLYRLGYEIESIEKVESGMFPYHTIIAREPKGLSEKKGSGE